MTWNEILADVCLLSGALFIFIGSLGVLNMPDSLCRTHALSKAITLGISLMLIGLWVMHGSEISGLKILLAVCFQLTTIPLSGHLIAHYSWHKIEEKAEGKGIESEDRYRY
jgi:multicomponent Na+:H+ antiporter subunit G